MLNNYISNLTTTDAIVSLQTITSVVEGSMLSVFDVNVELRTSGTLACDLVVTLLVTPGTATGEKKNIDQGQINS